MLDLLLTIKSAITGTFFISYKIGQFIVSLFSFLMKNSFYYVKKVFILCTVLAEDFVTFLQDLSQHISHFSTFILFVSKSVIFQIIRLLEIIIYIKDKTLLLVTTILDNINNTILFVINFFCYICVAVKQFFILLGGGSWFAFMFIPNLIYYSLITVCQFLQECITKSINSCNYLLKFAQNLITNLFNFVTEVPIEAALGLLLLICFINIFVHFYDVLFGYIRDKLRILTHFFINLYSKHRGENFEYDTKMTSEDIVCVICQDNLRCILMLPCKHLCLCNGCAKRITGLRRSQCPICRKPIAQTLRVYV